MHYEISMASLNAINTVISTVNRQNTIEDVWFFLTRHKVKREGYEQHLVTAIKKWEKTHDEKHKQEIVDSLSYRTTKEKWTPEAIDLLIRNRYYFGIQRAAVRSEREEKGNDAYTDDAIILHKPTKEMQNIFYWFEYMFKSRVSTPQTVKPYTSS